jgi:hypothetical protein
MARRQQVGTKRALRLAREAAVAVDARIDVVECDGEIFEGPVVCLEYLREHEQHVPIEAREAALERATALLAEHGLQVVFRPRVDGETFKTFVEICLDPVHDSAMRALLGSSVPESPSLTTITAIGDAHEDASSSDEEPFIVKNLSEGIEHTAAMARGLAQLLQIVAESGCVQLQIGVHEPGLIVYALGAPDAGGEPLRQLAERLVGAASAPDEPLGEMPAEVQLDVVTRTSDAGDIGAALEIRIVEQPPAGWSVVG